MTPDRHSMGPDTSTSPSKSDLRRRMHSETVATAGEPHDIIERLLTTSATSVQAARELGLLGANEGRIKITCTDIQDTTFLNVAHTGIGFDRSAIDALTAAVGRSGTDGIDKPPLLVALVALTEPEATGYILAAQRSATHDPVVFIGNGLGFHLVEGSPKDTIIQTSMLGDTSHGMAVEIPLRDSIVDPDFEATLETLAKQIQSDIPVFFEYTRG